MWNCSNLQSTFPVSDNFPTVTNFHLLPIRINVDTMLLIPSYTSIILLYNRVYLGNEIGKHCFTSWTKLYEYDLYLPKGWRPSNPQCQIYITRNLIMKEISAADQTLSAMLRMNLLRNLRIRWQSNGQQRSGISTGHDNRMFWHLKGSRFDSNDRYSKS